MKGKSFLGRAFVVKVVNLFFESDIHTSCVSKIVLAVIMVIDGDHPYSQKWEDMLQIIADFQIIISKTGKVFYDDTVDLLLFDLLDHFLKVWSVKVCSGKPVIFVNAVFDTREIPNKQGLSAVLLRRKPSFFVSVFSFSATLPSGNLNPCEPLI